MLDFTCRYILFFNLLSIGLHAVKEHEKKYYFKYLKFSLCLKIVLCKYNVRIGKVSNEINCSFCFLGQILGHVRISTRLGSENKIF